MTERNYETLLAQVREYFDAKNAEAHAEYDMHGTRGAVRREGKVTVMRAYRRLIEAERVLRDEIKIEKTD